MGGNLQRFTQEMNKRAVGLAQKGFSYSLVRFVHILEIL